MVALNRLSVRSLSDSIKDAIDNTNDFFGREMTSYNSQKGRSSTLVAVSNRQVTDREFQALNALMVAKRDTDRILAQEKLFKSKNTEATNLFNRIYSEAKTSKLEAAQVVEVQAAQAELEKQQAVGDRAKVVEAQQAVNTLIAEQAEVGRRTSAEKGISLSESAKQVKVLGGDTIQLLAARELGDPDRYKELVMMNGLNEPYISTVSGDGVLAPGDTILIPSATPVSNIPNVRASLDKFAINKGLEVSEERLGIDLSLNDDFDLEVSAINDAKLVAGSANLGQALSLKLLYDKGSLKRHPGIGTDFGIGRRSGLDYSNLANQARSTINSDPRVSSVIFVELFRASNTTDAEASKQNTLTLNVLVSVKGLNEPIPFSLEV
jgi:hypothetical protein